MTGQDFAIAIAAIAIAISIVTEFRTGLIYNVITFPAAFLILFFKVAKDGLGGPWTQSAIGTAASMVVVLLLVHLLFRLGAGAVKLHAVTAGALGPLGAGISLATLFVQLVVLFGAAHVLKLRNTKLKGSLLVTVATVVGWGLSRWLASRAGTP